MPTSRTAAARSSLKTDCGGAVYVEFLIAFLPIFFFFSGLVQLGMVQQASLVTSHAAVMAARGAAVVMADDPAYYLGSSVNTSAGTRQGEVEHGVTIILQAIDATPQFTLTLPTSVDIEGPVNVTLQYSYPCLVPIGSLLVCGGSTKMLASTASMPNQGANYNYPGS